MNVEIEATGSLTEDELDGFACFQESINRRLDHPLMTQSDIKMIVL